MASVPSEVVAPSSVLPGAGRSSALPRDAGRATEVLYKRHGGTVFRYAWHLLGRREDAEDATQATFLAVHGALAGGTAVLESGAWVMRIARNECMGRLRQTARRPTVRSLDDGFDPPAAGGVERSAELRAEVRTAQETLGTLPVPEREAFVLREWLGFESGEAALALGLTANDVDGLASRARRRLVIAVGGLEPAIGCAGTRTALEADSLDRAAKVHLLRCPVCRGVRRALRPPDTAARPAIAERLSAVIPGFASGGGILAALTAKAATAPVLAKTAAIVAAAVATGGAVEQAIVRGGPALRAAAHGGKAQPAPASSSALVGNTVVALGSRATPPRTTHLLSSSVRQATRGAAASPTIVLGGRALGGRSGGSSGRDDGGGHSATANVGSGRGHDGNSGSDHAGGSRSGKHSSSDGARSSGEGRGKGSESGNDSTSGSGHAKGSESTGGHDGSRHGSDSGSDESRAPAAAASDDSHSSGSGNESGDGSGTDDTHAGDATQPTTTDTTTTPTTTDTTTTTTPTTTTTTTATAPTTTVITTTTPSTG